MDADAAVNGNMVKTPIVIVLVVVIAQICGACAGSRRKAASRDAENSNRTAMGNTDDGSKCNVADGRESLTDLNQDGVNDVRRVYRTVGDKEILVCREADNNFDGKKDIFVFFDESGAIVRDEVDLDFDRKIDVISIYANGKVAKQEIDTNSDGFVDRIRYVKDDLPVRLEGDTNNDGQVDLWEYYEDGILVRIGTDNDGDGRVDSWSRDAQALKEKEEAEEPPAEASSPDTQKPRSNDGTATVDPKNSPKEEKASPKEGSPSGEGDAKTKDAPSPPALKDNQSKTEPTKANE